MRKEESRPGANDLIQAILDSMVDGVIVADDAGKVMLYNPAADDMLGEDLINPDPDQWHEHSGFFFPDGSARYAVEQLPLARAIRGETVDGAEVLVRRQDGMDPILIRATAMPLKDGEGDIHGGVNGVQTSAFIIGCRAVGFAAGLPSPSLHFSDILAAIG